MKIIKYLPLIVIFLTISGFSAYKVLVVEKAIYEKYANIEGKVDWVTFAPHSGIYLLGVTLRDGTYGEVNGGSYPWKVGDTYINRMQYGDFIGMSGLAYSVEPPNLPNTIWGLLYMFFFPLPIIIGVGYLVIYKPIAWWIHMHKYV